MIRQIAQSLPIGYKLLVKDHTVMQSRGWRKISQMKEIMEMANVKLVHPEMNSYDIFPKCSLVITIGGTASIEAAFFNKPSISFREVGHIKLPSINVVKNPHELPNAIKTSLNEVVNPDDVSKFLTEKLIIETVRTTNQSLIDDFGIINPRIAISGLNPHAGENGTFGDEEIHIIQPAVQILKNEGLNIIGPLSADTMFHSAARKQYDVAICMYHDQALIPIKTIDFYGGVNMTLGLPFIRTSPDHGTAFELAGTRKANPMSLINALELAHNTAYERL